MRKVVSIFFYVIAAFLLYVAIGLSFAELSSAPMKFVVLLSALTPACLALALGLAVSGFRNWRRDTGVVFVSAAGFVALGALMCACMVMSNGFLDQLQPAARAALRDVHLTYVTGGLVTFGVGLLGWCLLEAHRESERPSQQVETN